MNQSKTNTNLILGDKWNKYWSLFPPLIPIPGVSESLPPGELNNFENTLLMVLYYIIWKSKKYPVTGEQNKKKMNMFDNVLPFSFILFLTILSRG